LPKEEIYQPNFLAEKNENEVAILFIPDNN
jgi:hypothetical protein